MSWAAMVIRSLFAMSVPVAVSAWPAAACSSARVVVATTVTGKPWWVPSAGLPRIDRAQ